MSLLRARCIAVLCAAVVSVAQSTNLHARQGAQPLPLLDVPYISQSELLCGGAAAAMVLRYWGERRITAESFAGLVDRGAAGIRTDTLIDELVRLGWSAREVRGSDDVMRGELAAGRPVVALIEVRPSIFHYVVVLAAGERGVVFHDPATAPFRVMSTADFDRRWRATERWMGIVFPQGPPAGRQIEEVGFQPNPEGPAEGLPQRSCDESLSAGVRFAQTGDLESAERTLTSALDCPGALRELAGVRVLQERWTDVGDVAAAAVAADREDDYAWKLLATSRFVRDDPGGALSAWNEVGEPTVDLIRLDGLTRTRHRVVERLLSVRPGEVLTPARLARAERRLAELPSARSTRLDYVPVPSGLAELRGAVVERPLFPTGRIPLAALAIAAAATREVRLGTGSLSGGGEQLFGSWRFWPGRPGISGGITAPAPWGGVWDATFSSGRQPFTSPVLPTVRRTGARLGTANWLTPKVRWNATVGIERWGEERSRGVLGARLRFMSGLGRLDAHAGVDTWLGARGFSTAEAALRFRSSGERRGQVVVTAVTLQSASYRAPLDLWWAGDTGSARSALLRAHPLVTGGQFRADRLGRMLVEVSIEAQRWWRVAGPVSVAAASFVDSARTALRFEGPPLVDVDVGLGVRLSVTGLPGLVRVDVGQGLRDGRTALSFVYEP